MVGPNASLVGAVGFYRVTGSLLGILATEQQAYAEAITVTARRAATKMKNRGRAQMKRAGLGDRLPNALRDFVFPKSGVSADAVGGIYSKALVRRDGDAIDVILAHEQGAAISAKGHPFLALATDRVGTRGGRRLQPRDYPAGFLHVEMQLDGSGGRLVDGQGRTYFVLVPAVSLKPTLDLDRVRRQVAETFDVDVVIEWERRSVRAGVQPTLPDGRLKRAAARQIGRAGFADAAGGAGPGLAGSRALTRLNDSRSRYTRRGK